MIGAVLLVAIIVIGGTVVAAMVFKGQPTPKGLPHVDFGVTLDAAVEELTLHHTGGDALRYGEYMSSCSTRMARHITAPPTSSTR